MEGWICLSKSVQIFGIREANDYDFKFIYFNVDNNREFICEISSDTVLN